MIKNENIKGLHIINNFIDNLEQKELLENIYNNIWDNTIKRRVQHYGSKFNYKIRKIDNSYSTFPEWLNIVINKFKLIDNLKYFKPDQCTINEYLPGIGIAPHIDTHSCFGNKIVSLSLEHPRIMKFQNKNINGSNIDIKLEEKSLLILEDESRYCYSHGISFRKTDKYNDKIVKRKKRVSITFREIRKDPCKCKWPNLCDSQDGILEPTRL